MAQKMRFSLPVRLWLWLHRFTNYHDYLDQTDDQLEGGGGKKTPFLRHFILKMIIYQDRLGTNIGKFEKE